MVSFSFDKFMRGLASGSDSGLGSFAKPYVQGRTQDALNKGIGQIQEGDWNGGISTIGEWSPETAMSLAQYKQKQDDAMNMAQMKIAADIQNRNTLTPYQQEMLALKRQQLAQNGGGTGSIKNIEYLVGQGYTPEQAANMVFSGQNPAVAGLGEKGYNKYTETTGKNLAEDEEQLRNLEANMPALQEMVSELHDLANKATYTATGRGVNKLQTELFGRSTQGDVAAKGYETRVNQNLLPLLRQTFGAAFTEKDREQLQKTLGDPTAHPDIKHDALQSFIRNKQREIESKRRKIQSYSLQPQEEVIDYTNL